MENPLARSQGTTQHTDAFSSTEGAPAAAEAPATAGKSSPACAGAGQGAAASLPAWLTGIDSAAAARVGLQTESQETPAAKISSSRAFLGGSPPGTGLQSYSCRQSVPEWLVSPVRSSRLAGELSPIKRLIAEIDAHLAADEARNASAALFGGVVAVYTAELLDGKTWFSNPEYAAAAQLDAVHEKGAHAQTGAALEAIAEDDWAASAVEKLPPAGNEAVEMLISDATGVCAGMKATPMPDSPLSSVGGCTAESATRQQLFQDLAAPEPAAGLTLGSCGSSPVHFRAQGAEVHAAQVEGAAAARTQGAAALQQAGMGASAWEEGAAAAKAATAPGVEDSAAVTAAAVEDSTACLHRGKASADGVLHVRILRRSVSPRQLVGAQPAPAAGSPAAAAEDGAACKPPPIDVSFYAASADPDKENTPSPGAEVAGSKAMATSSSGRRPALAELHAASPHADAGPVQECDELPLLPNIEASPGHASSYAIVPEVDTGQAPAHAWL